MTDKRELQANALGVVLSKALGDAAFKTQLLTNPKEAFAALGIAIPDGVRIKFVEDTATVWHFVIPEALADGELGDADLDKVAGGLSDIHLTAAQIGRLPRV